MLNNVESGWQEFMESEHSLEEYLQKFGTKLKREDIYPEVKAILMKEYANDLCNEIGYKVI
jgi:hypothetical protein